ncbi:winged helix-turn-helix domain-containing protein [Micromonospora sp. NPDC049523]|uniref:ArsR/SmtB family transcription factor n=1 Tax=Micromonospora sp. NPDC049523 TaxID=3155921 RepID=UPI00344AF849
MSEDRIRLDPRSLRGIAHPLRVRMLGALREHGPATATGLAERLGQSTGATSYHLRQLATYGFVVEDPERGVGRERWWRAAHQTTTLDSETITRAPADAETYVRAVAAAYADQVERWLGEAVAIPPEWIGVSTLSDWRLRLTPTEAAELHAEVFALAERYRRNHPDVPTPDDAEPVILQVQILPFTRRPDDDGSTGDDGAGGSGSTGDSDGDGSTGDGA